MKNLLLFIVVGVAALGVGAFGYHQLSTPQTFGGFNPTGGGTYNLQASINSTQSTITLTSFTEPGSGIPYTMSYLNTDIVYATINPETTRSEFISFTGITQNTNGTALLTGVSRGLERSYPFVASTTLAFSFPGQTKVILSSPPQFFNEYATKRNNQVISGIWNFTSLPTTSVVCSDPFQFCNKAYIDAGFNQGAATSTEANLGIVQLVTAAQVGSSTASTTAGGPLVLTNKFATSTPGTQCTNNIFHCIPVALGGKISQLWLDLTQSFTFSSTTSYVINGGTINATSSLTVGGIPFGPKFGGTGVDGALSLTSGITVVPLGTTAVYEKDYTSISMTGTGGLSFSSAATSTQGVTVILRSQGACTFTSSATIFNLKFLGGGLANAKSAGSIDSSAGDTGGGGGGGGGSAGTGSDGGTNNRQGGWGGVSLPALSTSSRQVLPGGNGTSGTSGDNGGGAGGSGALGAGALYLECAGGYTFTTGTIDAAGGTGVNGGIATGGSSTGGGGGGGGGAGSVLVLYGSLVSDTGTYTVTAGNAGSGGAGAGGAAGAAGGSGAVGAHLEAKNTYFP